MLARSRDGVLARLKPEEGAMSRLDPESCRSAAELCREQAPSHENPDEWVRFSLAWQSIDAISEGLQAISLNAMRPFGSRSVATTQ
jgi:hypothetical protein